MANLPELQLFASQNGFGLTAPLTHQQVVDLAGYWLPQMCFYWDERFHPITLEDMFTMVDAQFAAFPSDAQDTWRVNKLLRSGSNTGVIQAFDPPLVHVPDGLVLQGNPPQQFAVPAVRVLAEGTAARDALRLPEVGTGAVVTHGASFNRSNQFFGPQRTLSTGNTSAPSDPFLPRADEPDPNPTPANPSGRRPRITVMAQLQNLFELLKYELTVAEADAAPGFDYPPDGMRGGFNIAGNLLRPVTPQTPPLSAAAQRDFLLELIAAHESGGTMPDPPAGWRLDRLAWNVVTRFAFLEYSFFYAYNDFERYQTAIWDNEHEGDDEGCCLVFDRNVLNLAATSSDPNALRRAVPHSIITSVHEEYQDADLFKFIDPPFPPPPIRTGKHASRWTSPCSSRVEAMRHISRRERTTSSISGTTGATSTKTHRGPTSSRPPCSPSRSSWLSSSISSTRRISPRTMACTRGRRILSLVRRRRSPRMSSCCRCRRTITSTCRRTKRSWRCAPMPASGAGMTVRWTIARRSLQRRDGFSASC